MAEAHSAVAFSFSITHEGFDINYDQEVLNLVWNSGVRSWKKRLARFRNGLRNGIYPAHLQSLWLVVAVAVGLHFTGRRSPYDITQRILQLIPSHSPAWEFIGCCLSGLLVWLLICYTMRYTLKLLFMYKGWMYESRAKGRQVSLGTRLWAGAVKVMSTWNTPLLYSFQGSLPRLPLPAVKDTMSRYLRSVRPLLDDENYSRMTELAKEFETGIGKKLQRYLVLKSWWATNYVSDWWEEYVYLRGRGPLMVNSNFYGIDAIFSQPSQFQAARAANIIELLLNFRRKLDHQEQKPIMIQGMVPLCSWQYERLFNTVRVPGVETDRIVHYQDANHIVVYHKGCFYKVLIYHRGRLLRACEIQVQLEHILSSKAEPVVGERLVASLTAGDRTKWAEARQTFFSKGVNKTALYTVESAAFVVALDDYGYEYDANDASKLDHYGRMMLHGKGHDRWFDKSFTLCVGSNGKVGFNAEHTWADAAVMSHLWEELVADEHQIGNTWGDGPLTAQMTEVIVEGELTGEPWADAPIVSYAMEWTLTRDQLEWEESYDSNGNCKGTPEFTPPTPTRIAWDLGDAACLQAIDNAHIAAEKLLNDVELRIFVHDAFGKGVMKKCRLSPDAFIQMALQLAYYRDAGKFSLTYEASMTRLFREGRTETVRPCTIESAQWAKAMCAPKRDTAECVKLLQAACLQHQRGYQDAMCGKGIDRHLFCLFVVSKYLEVDSPFLKEVLSEPWRLSTSQTPHGQTDKLDASKNPNFISAGGGFGPVADDGYGVSYIIAGEDIVFFHVSAKKSCPTTDADRFSQQIGVALRDIKELFEAYSKLEKKAVQNGQ